MLKPNVYISLSSLQVLWGTRREDNRNTLKISVGIYGHMIKNFVTGKREKSGVLSSSAEQRQKRAASRPQNNAYCVCAVLRRTN